MTSQREPLVEQALSLVESAKGEGIILRLAGASAVQTHCPNNLPLYSGMNRKLTDIDLIGYSKEKEKIVNFVNRQGFEVPRHYTLGVFAGREIFTGPNGLHGDIFFDRLDFCHKIEFKDRLESDYPTIPLAELLLEKTQIVKINEKDVKDAIILLLEHDVGEGDHETVNAKLISKTLAGEWGFYYTVTTNLKKLSSAMKDYNLNEDQRSLITSRINRLLQAIEQEPKPMSWRLRAKVGPSKKWYKDVEEVDRASWLRNTNPADTVEGR